jgi:hypothetical protein
VPLTSTPANACGAPAARTASTASLTAAVGAVLEADRHREAGRRAGGGSGSRSCARRSRPTRRRPEMYCGVIGSRNSQPIGEPRSSTSSSSSRACAARVHVAGAVEVGIVDQPLPAGRRARLLEVDPHRDADVVAQLGRARPAPGVVDRGLGSWTLHGPTTTRRRSSSRSRTDLTSARWARTASSRFSPSGRSSRISAGETSSTTRSIVGPERGRVVSR